MTEHVTAVYDAAKEAGIELSAISWNGFNLFGDKKSIDEVKRLMTMEARAIALQARLDEMRKNAV